MDIVLHHGVSRGVARLLRIKCGASVHDAVCRGELMHSALRMPRHRLRGHAGKRRRRSIRLKAASAAAGAPLPVRRDHHVPKLARGARIPREQLSVHDHTAADTGAEREDHRAVRALCRAGNRFAERRGVRVVDKLRCIARALLQLLAQRVFHPVQIAGIHDLAAPVVHDARAAETDAAEFLLRGKLTNQLADRVGDNVRAACSLRGAQSFPHDLAVFRDDRALEIGAAHVDAQIIHGPPPAEMTCSIFAADR